MSVTAVPIQPVKTGFKVWIWLGVIAAVALGVLVAWQGTGKVIADRGTNAQFLAWNKGQPGVVETGSGLQYQVLKAGEGPHATDEDIAVVELVGKLRDGTVLIQTPRPLPLTSKAPDTPAGLREALKLMQKGGKYRLWLRPDLARAPGAPAGGQYADVIQVFDIDVREVMSIAAFQQQMQMMQMMQGGGAPGGEPPAPGQP